VVGFYTLFHEEPGGRYRLQVCTDMPCALRGAKQFLEELCGNIGLKVGEVSEDGLFEIEEVTCLAGCHRAPMMQVQGDGDIVYHENLTVVKTKKIMDDLRRKAGEEAK
jgi:NADH:ubiquinone oxidoreductase subunit E